MNIWKKQCLRAYVYGTMPYRLIANARRATRSQSPIAVLFYHRIADEHPNDWTISNAVFTRQIEWLQRHFDMISLEEAQRRIRSGKNHRMAVSITFDDGYADNCQGALPLLIKKRVPCTYFVSTNFIANEEPFPHDVANGQPLRPNSLDELTAMSRAGIEIGGHTRTHIDLGQVEDPTHLFDEVITSARELETMINRPIRYFAFPFGLHANLNREVFPMAREAGLDGVCSAYGGYNFPNDDPFHLQRIHADPDFIRLKNWLTIDPRKLNVPRFDYGPVPEDGLAAEAHFGVLHYAAK